MTLYSAKQLFWWPLKTWEWNISGSGALPDECCTSRMEREQSFQNQPCGLGASDSFSEGASTWKTGVQESALKTNLWFPHHLRDLLKILTEGLDLKQIRFHHVVGKNELCPLFYGIEKRQICPQHSEYRAFCFGAVLDHEWGADFHLHTAHWYPLTLIKLHFYTGARRKNRLFLSGITDFFQHQYPGK